MLLRCEIMGRTGEDTAEHCRSGKEGHQFSLENVFHGDSSLKLEIDEFLRVESGAVRAADGRHCQQDNPDRVPEPDGLQQLFPQRKTVTDDVGQHQSDEAHGKYIQCTLGQTEMRQVKREACACRRHNAFDNSTRL